MWACLGVRILKHLGDGMFRPALLSSLDGRDCVLLQPFECYQDVVYTVQQFLVENYHQGDIFPLDLSVYIFHSLCLFIEAETGGAGYFRLPH